MPRRLPGFVPSHSGEIESVMPISSSAESKLFTPERVEVTMNSKNETNGRVKIGQGSRWATVVYALKSRTNSEHQERNKLHGQNGLSGQDGLLLFTP